MARTFDNITAGISFDRESGSFDGAEPELVYLEGGIAGSEAFGIFSISIRAEAEQIPSAEAWETPLMGLGLPVTSIESLEAFETSPIKQLIVQWFKGEEQDNMWVGAEGTSVSWDKESNVNTDWST